MQCNFYTYVNKEDTTEFLNWYIIILPLSGLIMYITSNFFCKEFDAVFVFIIDRNGKSVRQISKYILKIKFLTQVPSYNGVLVFDN